MKRGEAAEPKALGLTVEEWIGQLNRNVSALVAERLHQAPRDGRSRAEPTSKAPERVQAGAGALVGGEP